VNGWSADETAMKQGAMVMADVLGALKEGAKAPVVRLELNSVGPKLHGAVLTVPWRDGKGDEWEIITKVSVHTTIRVVKVQGVESGKDGE
jgi:hypothetical protein